MNYLTAQEVAKLLTVAYETNRDHHLAILLAFATGARVGQILGGQYHERKVVSTVRVNGKNKRVYEKTGQVRTMPGLTGTDVYAEGKKIKIHSLKGGDSRFHDILPSSNPIFDMTPLIDLAERRGPNLLFGSLSRQYLDLKFKEYGVKAGIHPDLCHMHALRHGIAIIIFDETGRPGAITSFLQHSSSNSALQYLAENDGRMADEAVANLWKRIGA